MKVIYGIGKVKTKFKRPIITIGIFDGVHLGHQFIIKKIIDRARHVGGTSVVLTFDPHPVNILKPRNYLPLLISLEHRIKLIRDLGVDVCIIQNFSRNFSELGPADFIQRQILGKIKPCSIFIGKGFTFGKKAQGNTDLLRKIFGLHNINVNEIAPFKIGTEVVSSTSIRRLIRGGQLNKAAKFLGRNVSVLGRVMHGTKRGKILGYPTANIYPCGEVIPPTGVYASRVIIGEKEFNSMCYIGGRPTYMNEIKVSCYAIEAHIFNFSRKIYGRHIEIEFLEKIRDEQRFSSPDDLKKQIKKDEASVKKFLKTCPK